MRASQSPAPMDGPTEVLKSTFADNVRGPHRSRRGEVDISQELLDAVEHRVVQIVLHGDRPHVVELPQLLHDLLQPLVVSHQQIHRALRAPVHGGAQDPLQVEAAAGEKAGDVGHGPGVVLHHELHDRIRAGCSCVSSLRPDGFDVALPGRHHGIDVLRLRHRDVQEHGAPDATGRARAPPVVAGMRDRACPDAEPAGNCREVGPGVESGGDVALAVEQLLLLADKPEVPVVEHADLDVELVLRDGRQLLDVHEQRAVTGEHQRRPCPGARAPRPWPREPRTPWCPARRR